VDAGSSSRSLGAAAGRQAIETAGYLPQGLDDLVQGLVE